MKTNVLEYRGAAPAAELRRLPWWQRFGFAISMPMALSTLAASLYVSRIMYGVFRYYGPNGSDYDFAVMRIIISAACLLFLLLYSLWVITSCGPGNKVRPWRRWQQLAVFVPEVMAFVIPMSVIFFHGHFI